MSRGVKIKSSSSTGGVCLLIGIAHSVLHTVARKPGRGQLYQDSFIRMALSGQLYQDGFIRTALSGQLYQDSFIRMALSVKHSLRGRSQKSEKRE